MQEKLNMDDHKGSHEGGLVKKLKIAIVTKTFPPFSYGGTETYSLQLAQELAKQEDIEVHVVCFQSHEDPVSEKDVEEFRKNQRFTLHIAGVHYKSQTLLSFNLTRVMKEINRVIGRIEPDIIQTIGVYSETVIAVSTGRRLNIPTVVFPRGSDIHDPTVKHEKKKPLIDLPNMVRAQVFANTDAIFLQSAWARDLLAGKGLLPKDPKRTITRIIPNALAIEASSSLSASEYTHKADTTVPNQRTIVWIGRFEPVKNPRAAIEIFRIFENLIQIAGMPAGGRGGGEIINAPKLIMVGDGSEFESVKHTADGNPNIVFTGKLAAEDVHTQLSRADILINTSRSEGFPQTFLEAMSHGLPVLCFDVCANSEIINNWMNGFVVEPDNYDEYAAKLLRLTTDHILRNDIRKNNLQRVKSYSWETIIPRILDTYHHIME